MQDAGVALQKASNTHQKRESLLQVDEDHPYTDLLQNYADEYRARQLTRERVIHNLMVNGIDRRFVDDVMNNNKCAFYWYNMGYNWSTMYCTQARENYKRG